MSNWTGSFLQASGGQYLDAERLWLTLRKLDIATHDGDTQYTHHVHRVVLILDLSQCADEGIIADSFRLLWFRPTSLW